MLKARCIKFGRLTSVYHTQLEFISHVKRHAQKITFELLAKY